MTIKLRDYQVRAVNEAMEALIKNDDPVLLECSVGGGKSYLLAAIARKLDLQNKRVLCLVSSSELVRNDSDAFADMGGEPSVFCASLGKKEWDKNVVFATPQSLINTIKHDHPLSQVIFNLIMVDEAHQIGTSDTGIFLRILRHFKHAYKPMRLLGMSGTPFRGSTAIWGDNALFKSKVGNISTKYLIDHGFLVKPIFGIPETEGFDFSKCKIKNTGEFSGRDLQAVIDSKKRLTWEILQEVQRITAPDDLCMLFCSTIAHCHEAMAALPEGHARMIIGGTDDPSRHEALTLAREKKIKYLVSVNCLLTGVNIPAINHIVFLRPTSSLLLYIQGIGRGLRLSEGKTHCAVLDFAGNTQRFQDIDDPIINEALQPKEENEKDYIIPCLCCAEKGITTLVTLHTRRCFGVDGNGARCDNYFEWKDCMSCSARNDTTARQCRCCGHELIDPNAKLSLKPAVEPKVLFDVLQARYWLTDQHGYPCWNSMYQTKQGINIYESFGIKDDRMKNLFYGIFLKAHCKSSSSYYPILQSLQHLRKMLESGDIRTPHTIHCKFTNNRYQITKREFHEETSVIKRLIDGKLLPQTTMPTTPSSTT